MWYMVHRKCVLGFLEGSTVYVTCNERCIHGAWRMMVRRFGY